MLDKVEDTEREAHDDLAYAATNGTGFETIPRGHKNTHFKMSGEAWLYLLAVLINAVNLFLQVFFTIMYSDLEWYSLCSGQIQFQLTATATTSTPSTSATD